MAIRTPLRDQTAALQAENVTLKAKVATLESAVATSTGGSILPRRTGGAAGVVVLNGAAWQTPGAAEYARYGGLVGVLDSLSRVIGLRQGGSADVTGWNLTSGETYYVPPGTSGALATWQAIPATGLPPASAPAQGQVRIVLGTVRTEAGRQYLDLRPDGLDFGAAPPLVTNYRELWAGIANGTNLGTAGKIVAVNGVNTASTTVKYDGTGTAAQIGAGFPTGPQANFARNQGFGSPAIRRLDAAPPLTEGRQLMTWAVGNQSGTAASMDGILFGPCFSLSATEHYVAQFYNNLLRIEKQVYSAADFGAGTTIAMTPLMTSVAVDSAAYKNYNTELVVTPEAGQLRMQVYHWLEGAAVPTTPQVNLLVNATGAGRFGYTHRQEFARIYKFDVADKASGTTGKSFT